MDDSDAHRRDVERRARLLKNELRKKHAAVLSKLVSPESAAELSLEPGERGAVARGCADGLSGAQRRPPAFFQFEYAIGYTRGVELRMSRR